MDALRVAVVGCGRWGPNHIRNFMSLAGVRVTAAVDPDAGRREHVAGLFPGLPVVADFRAALDGGTADALVVATPTHTHYQLVREALLADKHVLCEKPLCVTSDGAQELDALARARRRILMVGHVFLFNPALVKLKELIDAGELGALRYLSATRTNLGPVRADANAAYDLACHDISVFNWLLGSEPEWVTATGAAFLQPTVEDVTFISLRYPGQVLANVHASWLHPKRARQLEVIGSRRMAAWDDLSPNAPLTVYDKGAGTAAADGAEAAAGGDGAERPPLTTWDFGTWVPPVEPVEPLYAQACAFIAAVRRGEAERSDSTFAVGVIRALEAATDSLRRIDPVSAAAGRAADAVGRPAADTTRAAAPLIPGSALRTIGAPS